MNRDGEPAGERAVGAIAEAESGEGFCRETTLGQVGVGWIEVVEFESQGGVAQALESLMRNVMAIGLVLRLAEPPAGAAIVRGWFDAEPVLNQEGGLPDSDALLAGDEIDDAASDVAVPEANPTILGEAYSELCSVMTVVERAGSAEIVTSMFETVQEAVMFQHLSNGNRLLEHGEADE